ncbi:MAG: GAF domain-containing protein [Anaerolineae bacterium]
MNTFQQRLRQRQVAARRRRVNRWDVWHCDIATLNKMRAEVEQEMGKLDAQMQNTERQFDRLLIASDPIVIEEVRAEMHSLGEKWDTLRRRGDEIDDAIREKTQEQRLIAFGAKALGIANFSTWLQNVRATLLAISIVAVTIPLITTPDHSTIESLNLLNLVCSLLLTLDFAIRLWIVEQRGLYFRRRAVDIVLSLPLLNIFAAYPEMAQIVRLVTILRIGRLLRLTVGRVLHIRELRFLRSVEFSLLQRTVVIAIVLLTLGALTITKLEGTRTGGEEVRSLPDALWWGAKIVLTANVDYSPQSMLGRAITLGIILVGLGIGGVVIATITSILMDASDERNSLERQQEEFSERLSIIRQNIDLLTNAKRAAAIAATKLAQRIVTEPDRSLLPQHVADNLVHEFGCIQASIHLITENPRVVMRVAEAGDEHFHPAQTLQFEEGLVGRMAAQARRGIITELPDFEVEPLPLADGGALAFPLAVRRAAIGVLHLVVPEAWLRDDLIRQLLSMIVTLTALHLRADEVETVHSNLLESISDLQNTMQSVTMTREYGKLLFAIAEGAAALLNSEASKVMLLDHAGQELVGAAWFGMDADLGQSLRSKIGEGLTGLAAQTGIAVKSSNLLTDQRVTNESSQARRSGMRAELSVPIRAGGLLLGVLSVMSRQYKRFTTEEEVLLGALAGQAGAAILNARVSDRNFGLEAT